MWIGGSYFKQSAHLLDASSVRRAFFSTIWTDLSGTYDALCFDVIVPGVLRIPIDMIPMGVDLRDDIRDRWGN
jgi:hypothetical protein